MRIRPIIITLVALCAAFGALARDFNDKLQNRPYADNRRWHLGFSVGLQTQDLKFTHNGLVTEDGESWYMEQPAFQPGFCVNGLFDLRLNSYFNLRFNPGLYFGSRDLKMVDVNSGAREKQSLKSAYIVLPFDLKFSAVRYRNVRPYVSMGFMPAIDVAKKRNDLIRLKNFDGFLTFAFGCDTYMPYFKFIPEVKFCLGLSDALKHDRPDLEDDPGKLKFTESLKKATSKMIVLTFYFE